MTSATTIDTASPRTGSSNDPDFMASLARGLAVIRAFDSGDHLLHLAEIAGRSQLSRTATRRCLHTLEKLGYATNHFGRYALRPRVLELGHAYCSSVALPRLAQPVLDRLSAAAAQASSAAILHGDDVVQLACGGTGHALLTGHAVSMGLAVGGRPPAYCTSAGRVLLAFLDEERLNAYEANVTLVKRTERTVDTWPGLRSVLAEVRAVGYAMVDQEMKVNVTSIAVPVRRRDGSTVAAINFVYRSPGPPRAIVESEYLPLLRAGAGEIGAALDEKRP